MVKKLSNPYILYSSTASQRKQIPKATREINAAMRTRKWSNVWEVLEKYRELGATDTESRDVALQRWKSKYGKAPRGWVVN